MSHSHKTKDRRRGSIMVYCTLALPLLVLPLVGLSIDASILRLVQAKLQASVDGASLGAGRLIGTPANLEEIAGEFLNANFPTGRNGFFGADNLAYTAHYTPGVVKTVQVTASIRIPTIFGRVFGGSYYAIPATATATRKDTRVVMVIDRSGSMSAMMPTLKNLAQSFAQKFNGSAVVGGADELGLVAFDGSAVVGYPTVRPWDPTITATSTGGPDSLFNSGASGDMIHQIGAITANSGTGMAEALWMAYMELQKGHLRDLAAPGSGGVDQRLNAIVLFTDGVPSGMSVYLNKTADDVIRSTSSCDNKAVADPIPAAKQIKGWVAVPGPPFSGSGMVGLYMLAGYDAQTASYWMANGGADAANVSTSSGAAKNCTGITGSNIHTSGRTDLARIPASDMYGNATNTSGYTHSRIVDQHGNVSSIYSGTSLDQSQVTNDYHWGLSIWNSVDKAAANIRTDSNQANRTGDTQNMPVTIHVIAYTANNGVDEGLLKRVANTTDSSSFTTAQPQGLYVPAGDANALAAAFTLVASSLLHLSR